MKRGTVKRVLVVGALLGASSSAMAFVAPQEESSVTRAHTVAGLKTLRPIGIRVLRPLLGSPQKSGLRNLVNGGAITEVNLDARSNVPRLISGQLLAPRTLRGALTREDFVDQAREYIAANEETLGVKADDVVLDENAVLIAKDVQFLKFRVKRDGLLVRDAVLDFRFRHGELVQVNNQSFAEAKAVDKPSLAGLDQIAEQAILATSVEDQGEMYRVVEVDAEHGYELVRVREFKARGQDDRIFFVQVDEATGEVFEIRPTQFYLSGAAGGSVYPRTYYNDAAAVQLPYGNVRLTYSGGNVSTNGDGIFVDAPETAAPALNGFQGSRVKIVTRSGTPLAVTGRNVDGAWNVIYQKGSDAAYSDKNMAQSMTYYHLNKEIMHAKQYISSPWLDRQLTANVNLTQTCNAYWDGSTVNLFSAGGGCANTALISDVFYHEWGHGLDDNTGGIEDGAFSEGYGDVMSLALTRSNLIGKGFKVADGAPVRDLTTLKVYPRDANQEVHTEGLIIGGAFWDLFNNLKAQYNDEDRAAEVLSNLALKVIFTASRYTDVYAALLVIDGDSSSAHSANFCAINKAFARHGLASQNSVCL